MPSHNDLPLLQEHYYREIPEQIAAPPDVLCPRFHILYLKHLPSHS
ncbi:hypothetical protein FHX59_007313 [Paraburkholderia silvatlantica]|uniref:Uncharacterized protein n=1 Tax=Paraburkholderia silvatlantica TaxID=321895 RepID=A0A2U1AH25_9BURK|nr:hypothetical protein [Paraburkholderia silvatlantica]PVY35703.1 hypothetical protein C7411_10435 [Paraburkholderia silvatlantica]PXW25118.1 hypothetical protein C7413_14235 [Paraburkholderia silvatlantica]PYE21864.1 hypothetical protein C7410_11254 [Paraburkholderia silvatlantica]TDQ99272.1 hypothetical protein C7412_10354 [Paraburkholderia silvatlantica]